MSEISKVSTLLNGLQQNVTTYNNDFDVGTLWVNRTSPGSGGTQLTQTILNNLISYGQTAIDSLTGDVTASGPGAAASTISAGAVTLSKMANLAANSIIGNNTGSPATPIALTSTQVTAMLNTFTSSLQGLVPASGGGTTNFLRADGTFAAPSGTGGTVTSVSVTSANGFAGTVATATTTPAITISTTINSPVLAGNGTAISAASTTGTGSTVALSASPTFTGTLSAAATSFSSAMNMNSNQINNLASPSLSTDAATKGYVDAAISGLTWQGPAQAYANSNVPLTGGATLTIDGYSVQNGNLVLLGNQTTASQNGEYSVSGIGTAYTLTPNGLPTVVGDAWLITNGTVYANSAFTATAVVPAAEFIEFAGPTSYIFNAPLSLSGNTVSISQATTSTNGYLSSTDWNTFNSKLTSTLTSAHIFVGNGSNVATSVAVSGDLTLANTGALTINTGAVTASKLGTVTDGVTLDQSGAGSTIEIKTGGVGTSQLASSSVTTAKLATITDGTTLDQSGAGSTLEIKSGGVGTTQLASSSVTAAKLATITDGVTTDQNGAGSTIEVLSSPKTGITETLGQAQTANVTTLVRWGNPVVFSETAGKVYAADPANAATIPGFWVIGVGYVTSGLINQNMNITTHGIYTLASGDSNFSSSDVGLPVWLNTSGTFSTTPPSASGTATYKIGIVISTTSMWIGDMQLTGIN